MFKKEIEDLYVAKKKLYHIADLFYFPRNSDTRATSAILLNNEISKNHDEAQIFDKAF